MATTPAQAGGSADTDIVIEDSGSNRGSSSGGSSTRSSSPGSLILDRRAHPATGTSTAAPTQQSTSTSTAIPPQQPTSTLSALLAQQHINIPSTAAKIDSDAEESGDDGIVARGRRGKRHRQPVFSSSPSNQQPLRRPRRASPSSSHGQALAASSLSTSAPLGNQATEPAQRKATPPPFAPLSSRLLPLQVRPERPHLPGNCTDIETPTHSRNNRGPAPSFMALPSTGPSDKLTTLVCEVLDHEEIHKLDMSNEEAVTHIVACAVPMAGIASVDATPNGSDDEEAGGSNSMPSDTDADDEQSDDAQAFAAQAGPSISATNPLAFDGRTSGKKNATVFVSNEGRPKWLVKGSIGGQSFTFYLPFGCDALHAPGPLPKLRKRPCLISRHWRKSLTHQQRQALHAVAAAELQTWKGLLGTFAAVSTWREKRTMDTYLKAITDRWTYSTQKLLLAPYNGPSGTKGLEAREREVSQFAFDRPKRTVRRYFLSSTLKLPGKSLKESFEEYRRYYNWLAADPRWFSKCSDTGLLVATEILVRQHHWLRDTGKDSDIDTVMRTVDERIGDGDVKIFTIYLMDMANNALCQGTDAALAKAAAATGCPTFGSIDPCYRGGHLDSRARRSPHPICATDDGGVPRPLGLPLNRLALLPCSMFATPSTTWDTALVRLGYELKPHARARAMVTMFPDKGKAGVVSEAQLLDIQLPVHGVRMSPLADQGNKWLAGILQHGFHYPSPPPPGSAAAASREFAVAFPMVRSWDSLIANRVPSLLVFQDAIDPHVALFWRIAAALKAGTPSADRIASRRNDGSRALHTASNLQWVAAWLNLFKWVDSARHAELGLALLLLHQLVLVDRIPVEGRQVYLESVARMVKWWTASAGMSSSSAQLTQSGIKSTLRSFTFGGDKGGKAKPAEGDAQSAGDDDTEEEGDDTTVETTSPGGQPEQIWAAILSRYPAAEWPRTAADRSPSMASAHRLVESLMPKYGDKINAAPKTKSGLPSLNWFPENLTDVKMRDGLAQLIDFCECYCEQIDPIKPPPASPGPEKPPTTPESPAKPPTKPESPAKPPTTPESPAKPPTKPESPAKPPTKPESPAKPATKPESPAKEGADATTRMSDVAHLRRSLHVGLSPCNLYAALLMMWLNGELDSCHLLGVSLNDADVAVTTIAHRVGGIPFSSGFTSHNPESADDYRPSSRMFIVESRVGNWARKSYDGAVFANNIWTAVPWLIAHVEEFFTPTVASAVAQQLQEVVEEPALIASRAKMDDYALVNAVNLTQSRVFWQRVYGHGNREGVEEKLQTAAEYSHKVGKTQLNGVLPLRADWTNEEKRRQRDARIAAAALAVTVEPPAAVLRSRVTSGMTKEAHRRSFKGVE